MDFSGFANIPDEYSETYVESGAEFYEVANAENLLPFDKMGMFAKDFCHRDNGVTEEIFTARLLEIKELLHRCKVFGSNYNGYAHARSKIASDGMEGESFNFNFTPRKIDLQKTLVALSEYCASSELGLSMYVVPSNFGHDVIVFQKRKKYDQDEEYDYMYQNDGANHGAVCVYIKASSMPIDICACITNTSVGTYINNREEYDVVAHTFRPSVDGSETCIRLVEEVEKRCRVQYVVKTTHGYTTRYMDVNKVEFDVADNYNDDIDIDKIQSFVESDESGLMIMHGVPGTGKTTFLRKLLWDNSKKCNFVIMDKNMFGQISDSQFMSFLMDNRGSIVIFEDCEELLKTRELGNSHIDGLLNLSDGILGDMLRLKFICTFNAELVDVDKALLRKGRLKYIYEFKPLSNEKAVNLARKLGCDPEKLPRSARIPLCDVYNLASNGSETKDERKVGF